MESSGCKVGLVVIEPGAFKTPLTNSDNHLRVYERSWNRCSPEIKEQCALQYANCKPNFCPWSVRPSVCPSHNRVKWQDRIPNTDVLNTCVIMGIEAFLLKAQLRWVGHVMSMPDSRIPKQVFLGQLASGKRNVM